MRVWVCHCAGRCLADLEPIVTHVAFADDAGFLIFFVGEGRADIHAGRVLAVVAGGASSGVDKFYGFIGGETDQWYSLIYDGTTRVTPPHTKGYHFTVDMTNQAINWVKAQQSMTPDKPFLSILPQEPCTLRTTCPRNGRINTKVNLTKAGIRFGKKPRLVRLIWE